MLVVNVDPDGVDEIDNGGCALCWRGGEGRSKSSLVFGGKERQGKVLCREVRDGRSQLPVVEGGCAKGDSDGP